MRDLNLLCTLIESAGWNCSEEDCGILVSRYSNLGEDFSFIAEGMLPLEIARDIINFAYNFDAEEHASMWYGDASNHGLRDLLEDADDIQRNLDILSIAVDALDSFFSNYEVKVYAKYIENFSGNKLPLTIKEYAKTRELKLSVEEEVKDDLKIDTISVLMKNYLKANETNKALVLWHQIENFVMDRLSDDDYEALNQEIYENLGA